MCSQAYSWLNGGLPDYPWEQVAVFRRMAAQHPRGVCDLSIGAPVDPTPESIRLALCAAGDAHSYPQVVGTSDVRQAISSWYYRHHGAVVDPETQAIPSIGSKEFIAWLPTLLGMAGTGRAVAYPRIAYPTYAIGAQLAGVPAYTLDAADVLGGASLENIGLLWLNSPSNPTGAVLSEKDMAQVLAIARFHGTIVASDECYGMLLWEASSEAEVAPSIMCPGVTQGDATGVLAVYSLSKQSNMAGYRAGTVVGDAGLISRIVTARKHAGMIVPAVVQAAMTAALSDSGHVLQQKNLYRQRREQLRQSLQEHGFTVEHSEAGLYLWITRGEDCWESMERLAGLGIVAGPGIFYGEAGRHHVRVALTASDSTIAEASFRLRDPAIRL